MSKLYGDHAVSALLNSEHAASAEIYVEASKQSEYI